MQEISPYRTGSRPASPMERGDDFFEEEAATSLYDYWIVILKYRWTIVAFFLPVVCIAVLSILWGRPTYTASTTLYIENQTPNITGVSDTFPFVGSGGTDYYQTQLSLLRSRTLAARVIADLDLEQAPGFGKAESLFSWIKKGVRGGVRSIVQWIQESSFVQWLQEQFGGGAEQEEETTGTFEAGVHPNLIDAYLSLLQVGLLADEAQLARVQFSSLEPALSKDVVNAHAATFIRTSLLTRFELTAEAKQFLQEKLAELKTKVEQSEEALNRFRKAHKIVSLEKGENLMVERLMTLNRDLTQARSRRIDLESLYHLVQQQDNRNLSQIIDNSFIQQLKNQIADLEVQQARLATKFKPTYPRVVALQEQIDQANNRLEREVRRIVDTIKSDYTAAEVKEEALTQEVEEAKQAALDLRERAIEYAILEREVESNRTLYENVLRRTKETDLAGEVPISNIRVVDRAEMPVRPDDTHGMRTLLLSMFVGLFGGVGLAFLQHYLDNTLRTPEDVGRFLRLPTLGMVPDIRRLDERTYGLNSTQKKLSSLQNLLKGPKLKGPKGEEKELVVSHHPFSLLSETYRTIRTAILFSTPERPPQTLLITSSQPREGKTVTAINVAITLAQNGGPVLLIDADLRNGHCHRLLGLQNGNGLTNVLTGKGRATEFIKKTAVHNLFLLSRGEISPNPAELLGSEKMRQTLESLKADFPFIVIDSAPLLPITDTALLSPQVDGVLLVAKGQEVSRYVVRKACERLDYVKARILGVVLNSIDVQGPEYRDYRYSYQAYYTSYAADRQKLSEV